MTVAFKGDKLVGTIKESPRLLQLSDGKVAQTQYLLLLGYRDESKHEDFQQLIRDLRTLDPTLMVSVRRIKVSASIAG